LPQLVQGLRHENPEKKEMGREIVTRLRFRKWFGSIGQFVLLLLVVAVVAGPGAANAAGVERRAINIWSDGTRMSGDLWLPEGYGDGTKRPAILLTHGWGGTRSHLNGSYAPKFARAGFVVLTFDYRGWADSDSRLVIIGDQPASEAEGMVTVSARAIREVVDPLDQVRDISSALDYLSGEEGVDGERIGIWGTSYSGGHVIYIGARDDRVAAIVSQVGYQGIGWTPERERFARQRAIDKARGVIDPIPQGIDTVPNLLGTPDLGKMLGYRPIESADRIRVPTLVIDVDAEELFSRMANGHAVYEIVRKEAVAEYKTYSGKHYDIYSRHYSAASSLALDWFKQYLMPQ
jgi:dienelactone hydrolase